MTSLPTSGPLSLDDIHVAVGGVSGTICSLNDEDIRSLVAKGVGVITDFGIFRGKSLVFSATGGTITTSGGYAYHTFTTDGELLLEGSGTIDILLVGGGGGSGLNFAGGGGGGEVLLLSNIPVQSSTIYCTVGDGGLTFTQTGYGTYGYSGSPGQDSSMSVMGNTYTAIGGGGGSESVYNGGNSAGGNSRKNIEGIITSYSGAARINDRAGGGGAGANSNGQTGGGGAGVSVWGTVYGGGGGGGRDINQGTAGAGGIGGGGAGQTGNGAAAVAGTNGLGGGGGGAGGSYGVISGVPAVGGSGVAIVRYLLPTSVSQTIGGTITASGGYTYHTFTVDGTMVVSGGPVEIEYLVIGGGGGGGSNKGGGGGAGEVLKGSATLSPGSYSITIGDGGLGGYEKAPTSTQKSGATGEASAFHSLVAAGGGGGANYYETTGKAGGSGGGGSYGGSGGSALYSWGTNAPPTMASAALDAGGVAYKGPYSLNNIRVKAISTDSAASAGVYEVRTAFNKTTAGEADMWISEADANPKWLAIEFPTHTKISTFAITARNYFQPEHHPASFSFQGSNDESTWETLGSWTGLTWTSQEVKSFTPTTVNPFIHYRLFSTASVLVDGTGTTTAGQAFSMCIGNWSLSVVPTGYVGGTTVTNSSAGGGGAVGMGIAGPSGGVGGAGGAAVTIWGISYAGGGGGAGTSPNAGGAGGGGGAGAGGQAHTVDGYDASPNTGSGGGGGGGNNTTDGYGGGTGGSGLVIVRYPASVPTTIGEVKSAFGTTNGVYSLMIDGTLQNVYFDLDGTSTNGDTNGWMLYQSFGPQNLVDALNGSRISTPGQAQTTDVNILSNFGWTFTNFSELNNTAVAQPSDDTTRQYHVNMNSYGNPGTYDGTMQLNLTGLPSGITQICIKYGQWHSPTSGWLKVNGTTVKTFSSAQTLTGVYNFDPSGTTPHIQFFESASVICIYHIFVR